ncbi:hypothetical protein, partial [Chroococcidiopsis cubana]|uniref:hypothetical protein n=1 Tax=Chroococcidiopsis cubana TaxID=171392 RepID=UPI001C625C55
GGQLPTTNYPLPINLACDFFLSPLFKGVGGSTNYTTHEEIPPNPRHFAQVGKPAHASGSP